MWRLSIGQRRQSIWLLRVSNTLLGGLALGCCPLSIFNHLVHVNMYNEIYKSTEFYHVKQGNDLKPRVNVVIVNLTPSCKFLCIQQTVDKKDNSVISEFTELYDNYKQVRCFIEQSLWYTNGNAYIQ